MGQARNLYLIGSGFTKAVFPSAPLNADLLSSIIGHYLGASRLSYYYHKYKTSDIEKLLTRLDLDILESNINKSERIKIEKELASYFQTYRFSEEIVLNNKWARKYSLEILQPNDVIISLNYDCLLEGILDYYEVWSPNNGYAGISHALTDSLPINHNNILIYKFMVQKTLSSQVVSRIIQNDLLALKLIHPYIPVLANIHI